MEPPTRNITLRLPAETYLLLEQVAQVQAASISTVIRSAIDGYIVALRGDEAFRQQMAEHRRRLIALVDEHFPEDE
jgi:multidrug resistance efflux pump